MLGRTMGFRWHLVLAVWNRNFTVYSHTWKMSLLPNFFEPVFYLLGLGLGLGTFVERTIEGKSYVAFIGPGLMAAACMNGASFETTYNMFVRRMHKLYDAYLSTPAEIQDVVYGEILWAVTRSMIYGMCFFLFLSLFAFVKEPIITSRLAVFIPFALVLVGTLFSLMGAAFTASIKNIGLYSFYFTMFLTPLFLFSGIFFPLTQIPYGESIAWFTPLFHAVRVLRALAQGPFLLSHGISILWMLVACLFLAWLTTRQMKRHMIL